MNLTVVLHNHASTYVTGKLKCFSVLQKNPTVMSRYCNIVQAQATFQTVSKDYPNPQLSYK